MFRFSDVGEYYYIFLVLILLLGIYIYNLKSSILKIKANYAPRFILFYFQNISITKFGFYKFVTFFVGAFFVVLCLFRPQYGNKKLELNAEGVEVVFVVDVSQSMSAEDIKPQRLKLAQIQLKKISQILEGNKMGLVAFAGQVGVISPLTQDIGALNLFIDSLDFNIFTEQGTNISFALEEAYDLLTRGQAKDSKNHTKVIVLVTDGEDHSGSVNQVLNKLSDKDIKTFVIGVGTSQGGKIPIKDRFGQTTDYFKDTGGYTVITKPNFNFLKDISKQGGGGFYKLDFGSTVSQAIVKDFERLKKSKFESQSFEVKGEYFQIFLFIGIVLLIISYYLPLNSNLQKIPSLLELQDEDL